MTGEDHGCFIRIMTAAAIFLGVGYVFGQILLAPVHCAGPVCARWYQQLEVATVRSFLGMGCLGLAAAGLLPRLCLLVGAGVLGYTAVTSIGHVGTVMLVGVDFLLVVGVIGWILITWRPR